MRHNEGEIMNTTENVYTHFLFKNADIKILNEVFEKHGCSRVRYKSGESIFTDDRNENKIGIIEKGQATVFSEDKSAILRNLYANDAFGVATLFSNQMNFVSNIIAKTPCTVFFISADVMKELFERDSNIMFNYIQFLSQRIQILNKRISCFTAGSSEKRLYFFLDGMKNVENTVKLDMSMSSLSEMLDIGRASLYRAFEKLESDGFIKKEGKKIYIIENN